MNSCKQTATQRYYADCGSNMPMRGQNYGDNTNFHPHGRTLNKNNRSDIISEECSGDMNNFPLAMAYVPWQSFENLNEPYNALECGTLFKDLYLCFGRGGC